MPISNDQKKDITLYQFKNIIQKAIEMRMTDGGSRNDKWLFMMSARLGDEQDHDLMTWTIERTQIFTEIESRYPAAIQQALSPKPQPHTLDANPSVNQKYRA